MIVRNSCHAMHQETNTRRNICEREREKESEREREREREREMIEQ